MADQRIKFVGEYTDKGLKAGLSGATKSLKDMEKAMASVAAVSKQKYEAQQKAAAEAAAKHKEKIDNLKKSLQNFAAGAAIAGVALKKVYDIARQGAELEFTARKFDRLAASIGTTGDAMRDDLGQATDGLLSKSEQMALATDLMSLGLTKTSDETVRASKLVSQLGMDMNELVLALSNQTTKRFDQLGISVDGFAEKVKKLEDAGMSASDAFTEAFWQQAEAQLERVGSVSDTSLGSMMRMEASVKDLGDAFKMMLAPFVVKAVEAITTFLNLNDNVAKTADQIARSGVSYDAYITMMRRLGEETGHVVTTTEEYAKIMDAGGWGSTWSDRILVLTQAEYELQQQVKDSHEEWRLNNRLVEDATDAALEAADAEKTLAERLEEANLGLGSQISKWQDMIRFVEGGGEAIEKVAQKIMDDYTAGLISAEEATYRLGIQAMNLSIAMGDFNGMSVEQITDKLYEMGIPLNLAAIWAASIYANMLALDGMTATVTVNTVGGTSNGNTTSVPSQGAAVDAINAQLTEEGVPTWIRQAGGNFVVPPSWTGDSYPVRATAGERVQVTTMSGTANEAFLKRIDERRQSKDIARMISEAIIGAGW